MGRLSLLLAVVLMIFGLSLVTSRYQARQLFIDLERQRAQERDLNLEWRRLQLERAEYARNARVDEIARKQLNMQSITPEQTLYLRQTQTGRGGQ